MKRKEIIKCLDNMWQTFGNCGYALVDDNRGSCDLLINIGMMARKTADKLSTSKYLADFAVWIHGKIAVRQKYVNRKTKRDGYYQFIAYLYLESLVLCCVETDEEGRIL